MIGKIGKGEQNKCAEPEQAQNISSVMEEGKAFFKKHRGDIINTISKFNWVTKAYISFECGWVPEYYLDGEYEEGKFPGIHVQDALKKYYLTHGVAGNFWVMPATGIATPEIKQLIYDKKEYQAKQAIEKKKAEKEAKKLKAAEEEKYQARLSTAEGRIGIYEEEIGLAIKQALIENAGVYEPQKTEALATDEKSNKIQFNFVNLSTIQCVSIWSYYHLKYDTDHQMSRRDWGYHESGGGWLKLKPEMLYNTLLPKLREYVIHKYGNTILKDDSEQVKAMKEVLGNEAIYNRLTTQNGEHIKLLAAQKNDNEVVKELETTTYKEKTAFHNDKNGCHAKPALNQKTWREKLGDNGIAPFNRCHLG